MITVTCSVSKQYASTGDIVLNPAANQQQMVTEITAQVTYIALFHLLSTNKSLSGYLKIVTTFVVRRKIQICYGREPAVTFSPKVWALWASMCTILCLSLCKNYMSFPLYPSAKVLFLSVKAIWGGSQRKLGCTRRKDERNALFSPIFGHPTPQKLMCKLSSLSLKHHHQPSPLMCICELANPAME